MGPRKYLVAFGLVLFFAGNSSTFFLEAPLPDPDFVQQASLGILTLQGWYVADTGLWQTTGWWNSANSVTVLVQYSELSHSSQYLPIVSNTFARNANSRFLNKFYDDEGWWALAWISAYDWTKDKRFLQMAEEIFSDMTTGWDNTCGGGTWWSKERKYKNAIANELFLSVAANLASRATEAKQQSEYLDWAQKEWRWFVNSGMINSENLINDGLDSHCNNNKQKVWSYNQGVVLGGLAALFRNTSDASLLQQAKAIAVAAMSQLTNHNGILHDACEPDCGGDGVQFKGIFVRNLAVLNSVAPEQQYRTFLQTNAISIWNHARSPQNKFGLIWSGPFQPANAASQTSALDALLAAAKTSLGVAGNR